MNSNFDLLRDELRDILDKAFPSCNIEILEQKVKLLGDVSMDVKSPLDQVFRDLLLSLLEKEVPVKELQKLVTFCIQCCRKGLTAPTMPVVLLVDIFDMLTLDTCEEMFAYVENEVNVWKEELFFISCKNNLLRMCNDLLRRLSRSTATVFCGRILLFLAKFFPFSERSGLNIVSEFNLENVTEYGNDVEESITEIESNDNNKNIVIDYSLYCKFWSLQDFFRNPNQCYNKVQWKLFCSHATSILSTFQGLKLEYVGKNPNFVDSTQLNEDTPYFSKYLTNQKLLDLQIYDVNFRRFVLLQFLILFQYLTSSVKFKSENYELKGDQKEWIQSITNKIYVLLRETPPDGEKFAQIVTNIFQREEYWNIWKNDGCPEFKKSINIDNIEKKIKNDKPFLGDIVKEANANGRYYLGSPELSKLWNLNPNNLEACKNKERDFLPSLDTYFNVAIEQVESSLPVKDEENLLKDGNFGWRALRLLARRSPHFFTYSNNPINQLPDYLLMMVKKIAADRPGRIQDNTDQNDVELEANLFKEDGNEDMKQGEGEDDDGNYIKFKVTTITTNQFDTICKKVAADWKKLAMRLNFKSDEIDFFETENKTDFERARNMLHLWFEDDDDSTLENFCYYLEGLKMDEAAEAVKEMISQN